MLHPAPTQNPNLLLSTMLNTATKPHPVQASASSAFSLISKSWRDVRDSAELDLNLIRNRADSFKTLATSFDREIENFINSASAAVPAIPGYGGSIPPPAEIEFVKKLKPKLTEIKRAYSSPEFSRRVLERWRSPRASIRIDLSAIRSANLEEEEERGRRGLRFSEFWGEWKGEENGHKEDWEPIRALKVRLRELERKGSSSPGEVFESLKNNEFLGKVKLSLVRRLLVLYG